MGIEKSINGQSVIRKECEMGLDSFNYTKSKNKERSLIPSEVHYATATARQGCLATICARGHPQYQANHKFRESDVLFHSVSTSS